VNTPPLDEWEEEGALRALASIAAGLPRGDFDRLVLPLLRRLTSAQLGVLARSMSEPQVATFRP